MDAILRRRDGLFDVFVKNDGVDYWRLAKACIEANVDQAGLLRDSAAPRTWTLDCGGVRGELTALAWGNPKRLVLRLDAGGRRYVVKRAFMRSPGFKRVLPGVIGHSYGKVVELSIKPPREPRGGRSLLSARRKTAAKILSDHI